MGSRIVRRRMLLVRNPNYNGRAALFMYDPADDRLGHDDQLEVLGEGEYVPAKQTLTLDGAVYRVFEDWSVRVAA